ncbi:MAG: tRNA (adenosine(37)-N6)-threonylcarbamoyltransferase complex dimerization subunit type 1 TsaB [Kiritimatiellae bacterium]|nr:tRNA (adenosine(37)-N6)-threonylcarbamoyltransferase complex dimerization subunit type 1 TsaB [Kiritimatiellia bacterium]
MMTLVLDRSSEPQSMALEEDGAIVAAETLEGTGPRSGGWALRAREFLGGRRPGRIVCGTGPGSFAGIRASLAFAQGWALGAGCEVLGLPSPCACSRDEGPLAVAGDARRGMFWLALFDGRRLVRPVFLTSAAEIHACVPQSADVVSPDGRRIGDFLAETFAERYLPEGGAPSAKGLAEAYLARPELLVREPLPIYLNPAVRTDR